MSGGASGSARTAGSRIGGYPPPNAPEHWPEWLREVWDNDKYIRKRKYLVLQDMIQVQPSRDFSIDLAHLGLLLTLDRRRDGRFHVDELIEFHKLYTQSASTHGTVEFQSQFQAFATMQLWDMVSAENGEDDFVKWFLRLLTENMESGHPPVKTIKDHPKVVYLRSGSIKTLHDLLSVQRVFGVDYQSFYNLLAQVAAEEYSEHYDATAEKYTDVVPLETLEIFARAFVRGFCSIMTELGFEPGMLKSPEERAVLIAKKAEREKRAREEREKKRREEEEKRKKLEEKLRAKKKKVRRRVPKSKAKKKHRGDDSSSSSSDSDEYTYEYEYESDESDANSYTTSAATTPKKSAQSSAGSRHSRRGSRVGDDDGAVGTSGSAARRGSVTPMPDPRDDPFNDWLLLCFGALGSTFMRTAAAARRKAATASGDSAAAAAAQSAVMKRSRRKSAGGTVADDDGAEAASARAAAAVAKALGDADANTCTDPTSALLKLCATPTATVAAALASARRVFDKTQADSVRHTRDVPMVALLTTASDISDATALSAAVESNVDRLARRPNTDINAVDETGHSALLRAAAAGNVTACAKLVKRGATVQQRSGTGAGVLHYLARLPAQDPQRAYTRSHYSKLLRTCIEKGAPLGDDHHFRTPLHVAANAANFCALEALLVYAPPSARLPPLATRSGVALDVNARRQPDKFTALHLVARVGFTEAARLLVKYGADVGALTKIRVPPPPLPPLIPYCTGGSGDGSGDGGGGNDDELEKKPLPMPAGAAGSGRLTAKEVCGCSKATTAGAACDCFSFLEAKEREDTMLSTALQAHDARRFVALIDAHARLVNYHDRHGRNALHYFCSSASTKGAHAAVKAVLESRATRPSRLSNAIDNEGLTPLHHACRQFDFKLVDLLLRHSDGGSGEDDDATADASPSTASSTAAAASGTGTVRGAAITAGGDADAGVLTPNNETCLHLLAAHRHKIDKKGERAVRAMMASGAVDLNVRTVDTGATALHLCALSGNDALARLLLLHRGNGASVIDADLTDKRGETPLACALRVGHTNVAKLISAAAAGKLRPKGHVLGGTSRFGSSRKGGGGGGGGGDDVSSEHGGRGSASVSLTSSPARP